MKSDSYKYLYNYLYWSGFMKYYIYQLRATDEQFPFYIGKSFEGSRRLVEHLSSSRSGSKRMVYKKIRKILERGSDILEEILFWFDSEQKAFNKEVELISYYGRRDIETGILTNHTDGGEGTIGSKHSYESKQKMSAAKIGNKINVGRVRPDMTDRYSKPVTVFDLDGIVIGQYPSGKLAAKALSVNYTTLNDCVRGKTKACKSKQTGIKYQVRSGYITNSIESIVFKSRSV